MLIASLILLCANIILMIIFYRKTSHNFSQNAYRDRIREEVNRLIIDIEHESDHAVTILEDKIRQIEKLLTDTDRHIALVEQEHEKWNRKSDLVALSPTVTMYFGLIKAICATRNSLHFEMLSFSIKLPCELHFVRVVK